MKALNEFLNTNVNVTIGEFPKLPIENDIIDFLDNNRFREIQINISNELEFDTYYKTLYDSIEREAFGKSYFIVNGKHNKCLYIFNDGTLNASNPIFEIDVFTTKSKIDKNFTIAEIIYGKKIGEKKTYGIKTYKEFIEEICKFFKF